ncbi:MAG: molybdopterin molybdotransferase MoeA [Luteolibacter sp.]
MIGIEEARRLIGEKVSCGGIVPAALAESCGYVLAEDVLAEDFYPGADRAMMDGYVIGADEVAGRFPVVGEVAAGEVVEERLGKGEAMRIFTGALVPEGGGRVVMQEDCVRDGDFVEITEIPETEFIRKKGCEAVPGDCVLAAGTRIGGAEMAVLAQVGCVFPKVVEKPKVRHIATGNELVGPESKPDAGKIRDTNSTLMGGLLSGYGLEVDSTRVGDEPGVIEGDWDLLLISGGASVGDHDHGARVLREAGFEVHFDKVNLRPGKPLTFATRGRQVAFVIPGNPVSHYVCFHVAIRMAVELMCGLVPAWDFLDLEVRDEGVLNANFRDTFWPAEVVVDEGELAVRPLRWSTSGDTFSLAGVNGLVRFKDGEVLGSLLLDLPVGGA